ncbi:MAG: ammonia-forming cytochrome c nitrite reductase subunit c552, partial [Mucispirillum sp.]|nr:ammonia-forming cytochrome c nitrite reductase subunit c552 [Mucispirillum sp.]
TNWTEQDARYSIDSIKTYTTGKLRKAEFWLATLIDAIGNAERMGVDKATLDKAREFHSKAHILWEYWTAENSDGFHNPELARESITQSINNSMEGYDLLDKAMKSKVASR